MSAYNASPPVSARNTAPITANETFGSAIRKRAAAAGLTAVRMAGARQMLTNPRAPMTTNQTTIIGPNSLPMLPVPYCWITNNPIRTAIVAGTMKCSNPGAASLSPSMADSTEIAGVMKPSPYSNEAPTTPSRTSAGSFAPLATWSAATSESNARMPPSPSLSARRTKTTYFNDTMTISAQRMSETIPRTSAAVGTECPVPVSATWNA